MVNQIIFSSILQTWYVELRISRSISESPLEFEITRVDCIRLLGLQSCPLFGKGLPTMLIFYSFCGCSIVFVCLYLWCWEFDVDSIVSVPAFTYVLFKECPLRSCNKMIWVKHLLVTKLSLSLHHNANLLFVFYHRVSVQYELYIRFKIRVITAIFVFRFSCSSKGPWTFPVEDVIYTEEENWTWKQADTGRQRKL